MENQQSSSEDIEQPVAYDVEGHPLYTHPSGHPDAGAMIASQAVHMSRPIEMEKPFISDATKVKHDQSRQLYPDLNLSDGEYVIAAVKRHIIGVILPIALGVLLVSIALSVMFSYDFIVKSLGITGALSDIGLGSLIILLFVVLVFLFTYVSYYVYSSNRFFLTNESVIEQIQTGLFYRKEQSISLGSVEDASYRQEGLLQEVVNFGTIRLSTIGDETTYTFKYVGKPKEVIDVLNNAVESFKNGRPVSGS